MDEKTRKDLLTARIKAEMLRNFSMSLLQVDRSEYGISIFKVNKNNITKFAKEFVKKINIKAGESEVNRICTQLIIDQISLDLKR